MTETPPADPGENRARYAAFPSNFLAKLVKTDTPVTIDGFDSNGDLRFSVTPYALRLNLRAMERTPLAWTTFFVDFLGGLLVHKNIAKFADALAQLGPSEYIRLVNAYRHHHFGLVIDDDGMLRFVVHSSLIQKILTDDLEGLIQTETTDSERGRTSPS